MTPELWRQVETLYHAVLDLPVADRPGLLQQADLEVRREVESLLAQDGSALDRPAWNSLTEIMPLEAIPSVANLGTQIGHYKIEALIGAGGMGQVYRGVDSRLGRKVAIKIATKQFGERSEREARAISALNHPHICTLYDVGPDYLVMEYVEGQTLADRISKGALAIGEVLRYGAQIAGALAEAQSKGITHRDLKPGNVMIAKNGVKVLDFGLAKFTEASGTLTQTGAIMGTPAYMAPEQMQGKDTDARTDIYALGLVLYEMATGKRVVPGQQPIFEGLPDRFVHIVERCLAPEPETRWQTSSDVKAELEWAAKVQPAPKETMTMSRFRWWYVAAAAGIATTAAIWGMRQFRPAPPDMPILRVQLDPPTGGRFAVAGNANVGGLALSPDGKTAAYVATVGDQTALWVRALDNASARLLPGTDGAAYPFWSPDGKSIAFSAKGKVQRVDVASGSPVTVWEARGTRSGVWLHDGRMVFSTSLAGEGGLWLEPSAGGTLTPLTELDATRQELGHFYPQALPGNRLLYLAESSVPGNSAIYSISLAKPAERVLVLKTTVNALYASGYLLWWNGGTLVAQEFDPATSKLSGEAHPLAERVALQTPDNKMTVAVSENGYLLYDATGVVRQMQWFDPSGKILGPAGDLKDAGLFRISPDGRRAAATSAAQVNAGVWVVDQNGLASRITSQGQGFNSPIWSPDGRTIVFTMQSPGLNLFRIDANGSADRVRLTQTANVQFATDWSRDGRSILFYENAPATQRDLWILPVTPQGALGDAKPRLYLGTPANESWGRFSPEPNPRWVAYQSDESGRFEIYLQAFPEPRGKFRISPRGGSYPMWGPDGRELYYETLDNKLAVVSLNLGADSVEASPPREMFALPPAQSGAGAPPFDVAPDGKRIAVRIEVRTDPSLTLVANWPSLIRSGSAAR